jgi:hypothetical protein
MSKPVTPQEMFDLWQKMVNPGAYPLQSLMFPVLDSKELDRKIAELEVVEHWLKANVNMVALTIKSLQFQRDMVKGGEKALKEVEESGEIPNPALWAWSMMADAAKAMPQAPAAEPEQGKEKKRGRKR